jgi:hypothetical protein
MSVTLLVTLLRKFWTDSFQTFGTTFPRVPRVFSYMYHTRTCRGRLGAYHNPRNFLTDCFQSLSQLRTFFTDCSRNLTRPSLPTGPCFRTYTTSVSGEEAVEPKTISESSSPIAFNFRHNLEFNTRVFSDIYGLQYLARKRWSLKHSPKVLHRLLSNCGSPIALEI